MLICVGLLVLPAVFGMLYLQAKQAEDFRETGGESFGWGGVLFVLLTLFVALYFIFACLPIPDL